MCGLAGMVGYGIINLDLEVFHDLFHFSAVRGPHSTGLMTVNSASEKQSRHPTVVKKTGPSPLFIMADLASKTPQLKDRMSDVFIGHCRWATVGAHTEENAHPFDTGRFVSAHNGTLYDSWSYDREKSDSQLMFEKMESEGVANVLEGMRDTSAYAISMYDKTNRCLILARNKERPLYVGISQKRDVMYWASEYEMLWACASRHGVEIKIYPLETNVVHYINPSSVKKCSITPWKTRKLNPQPLETSKSKKRVSVSSDIDWGSWGLPDDDVDWAVDWAAAFSTDYGAANTTSSITPIDDQNKTLILSEDEIAKASAHYIENQFKPKKKESKKSRLLQDVDKLIDARIQTLDDLFDDLDAQKLQEAAEKAIEEAQGVTASYRPRNDLWVDHYQRNGIEYKEDEECCICNKRLVTREFMRAEHTKIDDQDWFVCHQCDLDLKQSRAS